MAGRRSRDLRDPQIQPLFLKMENGPEVPDAEAFLALGNEFRLGHLPTEQSHPLTENLAEDAVYDLPAAIRAFGEVDRRALAILPPRKDQVAALAAAIRRVLAKDGRIFISGCGATGRLAITLETLTREGAFPAVPTNAVVGFMAGGDAALIRSIEKFEDFPEYGARQLRELGFSGDDLLIAVTEGGETPWVIGTAEEAAAISSEPPWFLFCNPEEKLRQGIARCIRILDHPGVEKLVLPTGPMALSGSTRLQATTVQLLVVSLALASVGTSSGLVPGWEDFCRQLADLDLDWLGPWIEAECNLYQSGQRLLYSIDRYGVTVLTDTTERAPTFSLHPFDHASQATSRSWCGLELAEVSGGNGWEALLHRPPRTLEWPGVKKAAGKERLEGYALAGDGLVRWQQKGPPVRRFLVRGESIRLQVGQYEKDLDLEDWPLWLRHLALKRVLNTHSTLVMGRLGRFVGNCMVYVRPSNLKLIDRAARYVVTLAGARGVGLDYAEAVRAVFNVRDRIGIDEPVVLRALEEVKKGGG